MYRIGLISDTALFAGCSNKPEDTTLLAAIEVIGTARKGALFERMDTHLYYIEKMSRETKIVLPRGTDQDHAIARKATSALC